MNVIWRGVLILFVTIFGLHLYGQQEPESIVDSSLKFDLPNTDSKRIEDLLNDDYFRTTVSKRSIALRPLPGERSLHLRGSTWDVLERSFQAYGLSLAFQTSPDAKRIRVDLDDADYGTASRLLGTMTHLLFIPLSENQVLALPDTKENRENENYVQIETISLPVLTEEQRQSLNEVLKDFQEAKPLLQGRTLTLRADPLTLQQIHSLLRAALAPAPEILIEVRVYTRDWSHDREVGLSLPNDTTVFNVPTEINNLISANQSEVSTLVSEGLVSSGDTTAIAAALVLLGYGTDSVLSQGFFTFGGGDTLTGVTVSKLTATLSLTASNSQELKRTVLRLADQQTGKLLIGQRYPIETGTYTSYSLTSSSSSSVTTTTTPQVQYEDLGVTLEVKPQVMRSDDVGLHLHLKIESLSGSSLNNIPVLNNQEVTTDLSVKSHWTTVLTSNVYRSRLGSTTGYASSVPTDKSATENEQQILVLLTPRLVRRAVEEEERAGLLSPPAK